VAQSTPPQHEHYRTYSLLLVLPSLVFLLYGVLRLWPHMLDDGFIFLHYAKNVVAGNGLVLWVANS